MQARPRFLFESTTYKNVRFHFTDASGMSGKSTYSNGIVMVGTNFDGAPVENDPLGGNAGLENPYVEDPIEPPAPNPEFPAFEINEADPPIINGLRASMSLNGFSVSWALGDAMYRSGLAVQCPDNDCGPRVAIDANGNPVLTSPFVAGNDGRNGYWIPGTTQVTGTRVCLVGEPCEPETRTTWRSRGEWVEVQGDDPYVWAWHAKDLKPLSFLDRVLLRRAVKSALTQECLDFIGRLNELAGEISRKLWNKHIDNRDMRLKLGLKERAPDTQVYTDILGVFDTVVQQGGILGSITADISTKIGSPREGNATVFLANFTGWSDLMKVARSMKYGPRASKNVFAIQMHKNAITTIHEILHFNYTDLDLARAASAIKGESDREFVDSIDASRYWGSELRSRCRPQ